MIPHPTPIQPPDDALPPDWAAWEASAPPPPVFQLPTGPVSSAALDLPPMRSIRRRLVREAWVAGGFTGFLVAVALFLGPQMYLPLFPGVLLMLAYLVGCLSALAVLRRPPPHDRPVREHLDLIIQHLRKLMHAYVVVSITAFPVGMIAGIALAWTDFGQLPLHTVPLARMAKSLGLAAVVCVVAWWPLRWFYRWALRRTYAKDLDAWEASLAALRDE